MEVLKNRVYRHFKGDYYIVLDIATDSETGSRMVVYRALYGDYQLFVRSEEMFLSDVDCQKYPNCKQKERFLLQEIESVKK